MVFMYFNLWEIHGDMAWLGKGGVSKTDEFLEKFQKGGVISNPKIYVADFGP